MNDTQCCKHCKPNSHHRSERTPDKCSSKLLNKKQEGQYSYNNINNGPLAYITKCGHLFQTFHRRHNGYWWGYHPIGEQSCSSDHCRYYKPFPSAPDQCKKRKNSPFPFIVCT